jgi:hypothetical protein
MKPCSKCKKEQPIENFYKHPATLDGHDSKCIECAKKCARANRFSIERECRNCRKVFFTSHGEINRGRGKYCSVSCAKFADSPTRTHGMSKTRLFRIWAMMRSRCEDSSLPAYERYGGRGITYDPKWGTFEGFYEDMGRTYRSNLTIDRIDNDGNYCKENCRWATAREQANNRRNNLFVTFRGETGTLAEMARRYNVPYKIVYQRIKRYGWSIERALTTYIF